MEYEIVSAVPNYVWYIQLGILTILCITCVVSVAYDILTDRKSREK